jgi:predicted RND superfamily exporter protein
MNLSKPPGLPRSSGDARRNGGDSPPSQQGTGFVAWLAALQVRRPLIPLGVAAVLTLVALAAALRLEVLTGFKHLLPQDRPSVQELDRVAAKTTGVSTLFVVLQTTEGAAEPPPTDALRRAADALVPAIEKIGPPWVGSVENGVHEAVKFLAPRAGLFAELPKLEKLQGDIDARFDYEVGKVTGSNLDDEPPPEVDPKKIQKDFGIESSDAERYPDGYYQSKDGRTVVVAIRSKVLGSDFENGTRAIQLVREAVERVNPASFDPRIHYGFAGDLQTGISEYTSINKDLTEVGYLGTALIAGIVFLYYLRLRTIFTMLLTIGIGVVWTFGITQVFIGHLNMATGFLFTIVIGNGINYGIIYMARYLEARRHGEALLDSVGIAHRETWLPTLTAGLAAAASYGSLGVTEFRGFRDFGLIGGVGMILCWIATYWTMPSLLAVVERFVPLERESSGPLARLRNLTEGGVAFGRPFAWMASRAPRAITIGGGVLAVVGTIVTVAYVQQDPMEYNLKNLRNDESARAEEIRLSKLAEDITGYVGADGMAILVDRPEQVPALRSALYAKRDAAPANEKPFKDIHALEDFVPEGQAAKVGVLLAIKAQIVRAHKRKLISDEDWKQLEPYLPPADLTPFTMADLPDGVARAFTEGDGTRGRIVYISPTAPEAVDDAHYLFRWADSYRETKLPDGSTVRGSGRAVIYADMWSAIVEDVPRAVIFAFIATVFVVILAFRAGRAALAVLASLLVGIAWMTGLLSVFNVRLNFLNFIALPITFGIGVDYAVNIVQRYVREGAGGALTAVQETGGAVILCSLTTALGYIALVGSMNFAVRSMGIAAVLGELACLFAAVIVLPAALIWLDSGRPTGARTSILSMPPR